MPLHPEVEAMLRQIQQQHLPPMSSLTPEQVRQGQAAAYEMMRVPGLPVARVEDQVWSVYAKRQTPVRIYYPKGEGPFPCLIFFHGGGWVFGDLEQYDNLCRGFTHHAGCVTISVDYGLAPEYPFPDPVEESYAVTQWVMEHANRLDVDASRTAVGGDSAGGNLSAVVCQLSRDRGGHLPVFQLLLYPSVDLVGQSASKREKANGYFLDADTMIWFRNHYLPNLEDAKNSMASPLLAKDFSHLPPAYVVTAEYDPLRDEGEAYAEKLQSAGVVAEVRRFPGMIHGFLSMDSVLSPAKEALVEIAHVLKRHLG
ncbi:MAG: alpha/beta hydrolase [Alicyclobacillaceae bacterium]|nr:alpha/beta hydrolase [Alicyclobacillaceae bacterium]